MNIYNYLRQRFIHLNALLLLFFACFPVCLIAQTTAKVTYTKLQNSLAQGWNTWNTYSVLSHVKLPEGLAVNIRFENNDISANHFLHESYLSFRTARPEIIKAGYHTYDGSYTECTVNWEGAETTVESAHDGNDLVLLLTPLKVPKVKHHLVIEAGMLWNRPGKVILKGDHIVAQTANDIWTVSGTSNSAADDLPFTNPYLSYSLDKIIGVSIGKKRSLALIKAIIQNQRQKFESELDRYAANRETYLAQQSVLAWNMIFDPQRNAVIAPVSRSWSTQFGGHYVLFDWDTYFSGLMAGYDYKPLAYANVIEVTAAIDEWGMVPNYKAGNQLGSPDRSQPPIGSMVVDELYKSYKDKWLVEMTYPRLLKWNRWWPKHRDTNGYLCWGSDAVPPDGAAHTWQGAAYESGLDNSPMYDGVPFDKQTNQMALADVGLMSMYIADCKYLAKLALVMNKPADANELIGRAEKYSTALRGLWHDSTGMFLNKRTDTGQWSYRLSPTLFYPMLAGVATTSQAQRMVKEHLLNTKEFWGEWVLPAIAKIDTAFFRQDYWRGRIWAPLNFLVYKGLKQYNFPEETRSLAEKSNRLLLTNWQASRGVYENYDITGVGRVPGELLDKSDMFYHWGALLGYMYLLENETNQLKNK